MSVLAKSAIWQDKLDDKRRPATNPQVEPIETASIQSKIETTQSPSSPEALRQARLAFFLNGSKLKTQEIDKKEPTQSETANAKTESTVQRPVADDHANNNINNDSTKRNSSRLSGFKVSSSCQTAPMSPSKTRPLSIEASQSQCDNDSHSQTIDQPKESALTQTLARSQLQTVTQTQTQTQIQAQVQTQSNNSIAKVRVPVVVRSVNPTNFPLVSSPSRTQLSQYLQQREHVAEKMDRTRTSPESRVDNDNNANNNNTDSQQKHVDPNTISNKQLLHIIIENMLTENRLKLTGSSTDHLTDEKRVEILLWRLEEAITAGQFDKAAVLAKELAAIKRPSTNKTVDPPTAIITKPVAAPRSILPATSLTVHQSAKKDQDVATMSEIVKSVDTSVPFNDVDLELKSPPPRPAKRLSISEPSPPPRPIRPEEKVKPVVIEEPVMAAPTPTNPPPPTTTELVTVPVPVSPTKPDSPIQSSPAALVIENVSTERHEEPDIQQQQEVVSLVSSVKRDAVIPEASVRTKKTAKVSSGQQTTLTYQKQQLQQQQRKSTPSVNQDSKMAAVNKERAQSCFIDDTFKYTLPVRPN